MSSARPMSPGFSLWLDALRAAAALVVLFGHMAHVRFTRGDYYILREWNVASDAVIVFFVLSGVVIAYAAGRDGCLSRFAFNRLTRVLLVVAPALVFTVAFDAIGQRLDPSAYQAPFFEAVPVAEMFWRGLSFTNEWQGLSDRLRLGSNGPLWSLSYEVAFYSLFAIFIFLKGALRAVLLALGILMVGLPILALLPCWALGVILWRRIEAGPGLRPSVAWIYAVGGVSILVCLKVAGLPELLSGITALAFEPLNYRVVLGYSDEVLWNLVIALCIALHLWGVQSILARQRVVSESAVARSIRWVAQGSFSLYVMHYPTLHLLDASLPETLPFYDLWLLGLTLLVCFGFASVFERRLPSQRKFLQTIGARISSLKKETRPGATRRVVSR